MTEHRFICDRCRQNIVEQRTVLKVESGPLRALGLAELDFCRDCGERFAEFVKVRSNVAAGAPA